MSARPTDPSAAARRAPPARLAQRRAPDPRTTASRLVDTVPGAMDAIRQSMRRHVDDDTSIPQFRCMAFVARRPGATIGEAAAFLGVTMPTASANVDRLVRAGLLRARVDEADRRRTLLEVSEAGRARLDRIRRGAQADFARRLAALEPAELAALDAGLEVLRRIGGAT
jgi:DNA-binding MarR family transcriptional regulator